MEFRAPTRNDWPGILALANASVAGVDGAGTQEDWLSNRRFTRNRDFQRHIACFEGLEILGYGSVERLTDYAPNAYRLFVVTNPRKRETVGSAIFAELEKTLSDLEATRSFFIEYEADTGFVSFIEAKGYSQLRSLELGSGTKAVILERVHR